MYHLWRKQNSEHFNSKGLDRTVSLLFWALQVPTIAISWSLGKSPENEQPELTTLHLLGMRHRCFLFP